MHEYCFNFLFWSNEDLPRGDDFWMFVEGLSLFPGRKVMYTVFDVDAPSNQIMRLKKHDLGNEIRAKQNAPPDVILCGGFDPVDRQPENMLSFIADPSSVWLGDGTLPRVEAIISKTVMDSYDNGYFSTVLETVLEFIGRSNAVWGFVDLFPTQMSQQGRAFSSIHYSDVAPLMLTRQAIWLARSRKGISLSGIHWGNFLGNELLEKIGGRRWFLDEAQRVLTLPNGKLYGILRELESGVFFAICPSPEEFTSDPTVCYPLKWFAELLVDHDLI